MEAVDDMESYRNSLFLGALVISSKPGALEEEHTHATMDPTLEHIMAERELSKKAVSG